MPPAPETKRAVVETLAHPQPVARRIETHQRHKHQIERMGRNERRSAQAWLINSPAIRLQHIAAAKAHKHESIFLVWVYYGKIAVLPAFQRRRQQQAGVDLTITGQIKGDASGGTEKALSGDLIVET